jgi:glutaredoxin
LWRGCDHSVSTNSRWPNQSLKLTEITVDENAARCAASLKINLSTSAQ